MRFAVVGAMAIFAFALYGWGWAFRRLFRMAAGAWAVTLTLGLAAVVFLGGMLNAVGLAYPAALACVAAGGMVLAVVALWRSQTGLGAIRERLAAERWNVLAILIPTAAILAFTIATQLPPDAYNYQDDFEKYFVHPVRMLATGTLFGSPLSSIGSETLGGIAFLDGFAVALFPIVYINCVDAVFGLFLCLVLAGGFTGGDTALRRQPRCACWAPLSSIRNMSTSRRFISAARSSWRQSR